MSSVWVVQRIGASNDCADDNTLGVFRNDLRAKKAFPAKDWEWITFGWWSDERSLCIWKAEVE